MVMQKKVFYLEYTQVHVSEILQQYFISEHKKGKIIFRLSFYFKIELCTLQIWYPFQDISLRNHCTYIGKRDQGV